MTPELTQQNGHFQAGATRHRGQRGGYAAFTLFTENTSVLTVEYEINLLSSAVGDHIEAMGTAQRSGRTLPVCQLEYSASGAARRRSLRRVSRRCEYSLPPCGRRERLLTD